MTIRNGRGTCCFWLWVSNSQLDQLTWTLVVIHLGGSRDIRHGRKSVSIQFWNLSHVEMFRYSHRRDIIAKRLAWDWFITHPRIICKLLTVDSWVTCKWENIDKRSPTKEPWHEMKKGLCFLLMKQSLGLKVHLHKSQSGFRLLTRHCS